MFILHLPDKESALLILYYAKRGAETHTESLIEAPKVVALVKELRDQIKDHF